MRSHARGDALRGRAGEALAGGDAGLHHLLDAGDLPGDDVRAALGGALGAADEALRVPAPRGQLPLDAGARLADVPLELGARLLAAALEARDAPLGALARGGRAQLVQRATARRRRTVSVAPTETSAARSARPPPRLAVTLAARALACAASRVSRVAVVRARRAVDRDGAALLAATASCCGGRSSSCRCSRAVARRVLRAVPALLLRALPPAPWRRSCGWRKRLTCRPCGGSASRCGASPRTRSSL